MAEAMRGATKAMKLMGRTINLPAMQRILMEFEKESDMMDMKEECASARAEVCHAERGTA